MRTPHVLLPKECQCDNEFFILQLILCYRAINYCLEREVARLKYGPPAFLARCAVQLQRKKEGLGAIDSLIKLARETPRASKPMEEG